MEDVILIAATLIFFAFCFVIIQFFDSLLRSK